MAQNQYQQANFLHDVFVLSARPTTPLDGLLGLAMEQAMHATGSDVGGGIFLFETVNQEPRLVASALSGELSAATTDLVNRWKENPTSVALTVAQSGQPYISHDHHQDPIHFPLLADSRSSLWVPLVDGGRIAGVLNVESSKPKYYRQQHRIQLQNLAGEVVSAIRRLLLREQMTRSGAPVEMVGASPAFLDLERHVYLAAADPRAPVLITGERGSGKELAAWAIHCWSDRRDKPFMPMLASGFTESLVIDELFGHEKHAFTGAAQERSGKFKAAEGGTLFMDEVADMSPPIQAALLRVLERGELQRIGRDRPVRVDVRVIAATNKDLSTFMADGRFREDLYDRLSVFEIRVPPLRERREDIPLLASHFLRKYCQQIRRDILGEGICGRCPAVELVSCAEAEFYHTLQHYDWPGNVRELEKIIRRLVAIERDQILDVKHLPEHIRNSPAPVAASGPEDLTLDTVNKKHIERVLEMTNYNQSQAAHRLGIPLTTLRDRIKKLGIVIEKK
jgi:two-component system response regulator HydG